MIVEAVYIGIMPEIIKPGTNNTVLKPNEAGEWEPVKIRVRDGHSLGGCWKVVKGKKEYEAAIAKVEEEIRERQKKRLEAARQRRQRIEDAREAENAATLDRLRESGERDLTSAKSRKAKTKPDGEKG